MLINTTKKQNQTNFILTIKFYYNDDDSVIVLSLQTTSLITELFSFNEKG